MQHLRMVELVAFAHDFYGVVPRFGSKGSSFFAEKFRRVRNFFSLKVMSSTSLQQLVGRRGCPRKIPYFTRA